MKTILPFLFLLLMMLSACSSEEVITEFVEVPALRASSIYDADSVLLYIETNNETYKELSDSYQKKSLEIQDKDLDKAIYFCKRAITLHPAQDLYITLGNLLVKAKQYKEASELYTFLTYTHYSSSTKSSSYVFSEPSEDILYEQIALYCLRNNGAVSSYDIYQYKEDGRDLKKLKNRLLEDERLKIDTSMANYKNFKLLFMSDEEIEEYKNSEEVYKGFLASITDTSSIFEIDAKHVQAFNYNREYDNEMDMAIEESSFYVNFLQEKKENNNLWYEYNYTHLYPLYKNVTAIVYAIDTSEAGCPKDMRHIYHRLVLYNDKGKIMDHKVIAFQSGEDLATATVNQGDVTIKFFKRKWRNPYNKKDFDNDLLRVEEVGNVSYKMNAQGQIVQRGLQPDTTAAPL